MIVLGLLCILLFGPGPASVTFVHSEEADSSHGDLASQIKYLEAYSNLIDKNDEDYGRPSHHEDEEDYNHYSQGHYNEDEISVDQYNKLPQGLIEMLESSGAENSKDDLIEGIVVIPREVSPTKDLSMPPIQPLELPLCDDDECVYDESELEDYSEDLNSDEYEDVEIAGDIASDIADVLLLSLNKNSSLSIVLKVYKASGSSKIKASLDEVSSETIEEATDLDEAYYVSDEYSYEDVVNPKTEKLDMAVLTPGKTGLLLDGSQKEGFLVLTESSRERRSTERGNSVGTLPDEKYTVNDAVKAGRTEHLLANKERVLPPQYSREKRSLDAVGLHNTGTDLLNEADFVLFTVGFIPEENFQPLQPRKVDPGHGSVRIKRAPTDVFNSASNVGGLVNPNNVLRFGQTGFKRFGVTVDETTLLENSPTSSGNIESPVRSKRTVVDGEVNEDVRDSEDSHGESKRKSGILLPGKSGGRLPRDTLSSEGFIVVDSQNASSQRSRRSDEFVAISGDDYTSGQHDETFTSHIRKVLPIGSQEIKLDVFANFPVTVQASVRPKRSHGLMITPAAEREMLLVGTPEEGQLSAEYFHKGEVTEINDDEGQNRITRSAAFDSSLPTSHIDDHVHKESRVHYPNGHEHRRNQHGELLHGDGHGKLLRGDGHGKLLRGDGHGRRNSHHGQLHRKLSKLGNKPRIFLKIQKSLLAKKKLNLLESKYVGHKVAPHHSFNMR